MTQPNNTASGAADKALAYLDALSDDAAAHIFPSDLAKCMTSECVVEVFSVRAGNPNEKTVPLFSREQVVAALASAAVPAEGSPVHSKEYLAAKYSAAALASRGQAPAQQGVQWQCGPQANGFTTPQADSQPAPQGEPWYGHHFKEVRRGYWQCSCGKVISEAASTASKSCYPSLPRRHTYDDDGEELFTADHMRAYVDADRAARAPADSVTAPAGGVAAGIEAAAKLLERKADDFARENGSDDLGSLSFGRGAHADAKLEYHSTLLELAEEIRSLAPPPPAQAADSVLEDAARLDWLGRAGPTSICVVMDRDHDGEVEVSTDDVDGYGNTLREAIDAAMKKGANHD